MRRQLAIRAAIEISAITALLAMGALMVWMAVA